MIDKRPEYDVVLLLAGAWRGAVDALHARLAAEGFADVRPAHGFAFSRMTPDGATGQQLADHLGISRQAAGKMVDELEARGYVRREGSPGDRRGRRPVVLTERGRACTVLVEQALGEAQHRWAGELGDERLAALRASLRSVLAVTPPAHPLRPVW